jgi:hypothetical protein
MAPGILVAASPAARARIFANAVCARASNDIEVLVLLPLAPADFFDIANGDTHRPGSALYARLQAVVDDLAAHPPRGWSSWCTDDVCGLLDLCFESEVRAVADALAAPPLAALNYCASPLRLPVSARPRRPLCPHY